MEFVGLLAPIAFVFAISALTQVGSLKKEVQELQDQLLQLQRSEFSTD